MSTREAAWACYLYDFGDSCEHVVKIETSLHLSSFDPTEFPS